MSSAGCLSSQAPAASVFARASVPLLRCHSCRVSGALPAAPRRPSLPLSIGETLVPCRTTRSRASSGPPPARIDRLRKRGWPDPLHRGQRTVPMELLLMGRLLVKDLPDLLALQLRPRRLSRPLAQSSALAPLRMVCRRTSRGTPQLLSEEPSTWRQQSLPQPPRPRQALSFSFRRRLLACSTTSASRCRLRVCLPRPRDGDCQTDRRFLAC